MPPQSKADPRSPIGLWVKAVLEKHGVNTRQQKIRTGIAHSTVNEWLADTRPQAGSLIQFARGMGEDVNEALRLANYPPLDDEPESGDAWYIRALRDLANKRGEPVRVSFEPRDHPMTLEEAKAEFADLVRELEEEDRLKAR